MSVSWQEWERELLEREPVQEPAQPQETEDGSVIRGLLYSFAYLFMLGAIGYVAWLGVQFAAILISGAYR
jgi:hypothetical protein